MKIGIIKQKFVKLSGGSERYTSGLVAALKKTGHELHVFTAIWDQSAEAQGVTLHRVPVLGGFSFTRQWSFAVNCRRAIGRAPCDMVFSLDRSLKSLARHAGLALFRPPFLKAVVACTMWHTLRQCNQNVNTSFKSFDVAQAHGSGFSFRKTVLIRQPSGTTDDTTLFFACNVCSQPQGSKSFGRRKHFQSPSVRGAAFLRRDSWSAYFLQWVRYLEMKRHFWL